MNSIDLTPLYRCSVGFDRLVLLIVALNVSLIWLIMLYPSGSESN